jgi:hypothetical protein
MDINKKLTELIDGVDNGDIDTLAELQRELIYLRGEIQALRIHDVVGRSEQLKCQCKKAKFTRTVDADFNPLCGRCGKAL